MSLHLTLHVNGHSIFRTLAIQRLTPKKSIPADSTVCTYRATIFDGPAGIRNEPFRSVTVKHRYGDGAWELVRKALNEIHEQEN